MIETQIIPFLTINACVQELTQNERLANIERTVYHHNKTKMENHYDKMY